VGFAADKYPISRHRIRRVCRPPARDGAPPAAAPTGRGAGRGGGNARLWPARLLTLSARDAILDEKAAAAIPNAAAGRYVIWTVADTGAGIEPRNLDRVFDPFSPPKRSAKAPAWACPPSSASVHVAAAALS